MSKPTKSNKPSQPKQTAVDAYAASHLNCTLLIEKIQAAIQDTAAPDVADGKINWTHVGNMEEVERRLKAIAAFIDGSEK